MGWAPDLLSIKDNNAPIEAKPLNRTPFERRGDRNGQYGGFRDRCPFSVGQKRSIKKGSHAHGVQRDRLDLDAHDLRLLRFLEHRVERVRLGPAVYRHVDSVRNRSLRFDGSFGHVRMDGQV